MAVSSRRARICLHANGVILRLLWLLLVITNHVDGTATVTPKVQIVTAGQPTVFNCSIIMDSNSSGVQWSVIDTNQLSKVLYRSRQPAALNSRYFVDTSTPGIFNLFINVTQITDSGSYYCSDNVYQASTLQQTGQLLVLGGFTVSQNVSNNSVILSNDSVQTICRVSPCADNVLVNCLIDPFLSVVVILSMKNSSNGQLTLVNASSLNNTLVVLQHNYVPNSCNVPAYECSVTGMTSQYSGRIVKYTDETTVLTCPYTDVHIQFATTVAMVSLDHENNKNTVIGSVVAICSLVVIIISIPIIVCIKRRKRNDPVTEVKYDDVTSYDFEIENAQSSSVNANELNRRNKSVNSLQIERVDAGDDVVVYADIPDSEQGNSNNGHSTSQRNNALYDEIQIEKNKKEKTLMKSIDRTPADALEDSTASRTDPYYLTLIEDNNPTYSNNGHTTLSPSTSNEGNYTALLARSPPVATEYTKFTGQPGENGIATAMIPTAAEMERLKAENLQLKLELQNLNAAIDAIKSGLNSS